MENYYLGFDAGTQSVKVAVYNSNMQCVAVTSNSTTLYYPHPGWVEMEAQEYYRLTVLGMKQCAEQMRRKKLNVNAVRSIMGDGIICGIVGIDEEGKAITPYINYLDSRTQQDAAGLQLLDLDIWAQETGNPQPICMFPAMHARWILQNIKAFQQSGKKFVHNAPYILMQLAGLKSKNAFVDWGTMSGWGLGYNVYKKEWSDEQLDILKIDRSFMPQIVKPWDIIGYLTGEIAEETGFMSGIPICAGAGDTMQSMLGSGIFGKGRAVDVAGTCAMFCVSTDRIIPELSQKGRDLIFNSGTLENTYFYWGFIRTGGLALRWFRDNICQEEKNDDYYSELSQKAAELPPGCNGVRFLPYLTGGIGEFSNASGCFLNMTMDTDRYVMWRAVLEAIGYDYIEITDCYRKAGVNLDRITITEGGSRDVLWNQIKSDMIGSEVVTLETLGGAVLTNCILGAYAVGQIKDLRGALENCIKVKRQYQPDKQHYGFYRNQFALQQKLIRVDMQQAFNTLNSMR